MLTTCVIGIDAFWQDRRRRRGEGVGASQISKAARFATKTGRNDSCPCGSGKKFKNAAARSADTSARAFHPAALTGADRPQPGVHGE